MHFTATEIKETNQFISIEEHGLAVTSSSNAGKCYSCGSQFQIHAKCPAKNTVCHPCKKVWRYGRVHQSTKQKTSAFLHSLQLATLLTCCAKPHTTRSPNITVCDFFFFFYVKEKFHLSPLPANIDDMKDRITAAIKAVSATWSSHIGLMLFVLPVVAMLSFCKT